MSPHEKYERVKSAFIRTLEDSGQFHEVKLHFAGDVSCRRMDLMESPSDLLATLEGQHLIGYDTIVGFKKISDALRDPGLECLMENFLQEISEIPVCPGVNQYAEERKNQASLGEVCAQGKKKEQEKLPNVPQRKRDEIFRLIAEQIGRKWIDFARGLGFRQGKLDTLRDHPARVYVILEETENQKPHEIFSLILKALEESRRNDLRERIQKILLEK